MIYLRALVSLLVSSVVLVARYALFLALLLVPRPAAAEETAPLLAAAAESARDQRIRETTEALSFGVVLAGAGVASWVTPSEPSARETRDIAGGVLVGAGGLLLAGSALALAFGCESHPPASLETMAHDARKERVAKAIASFVFGALELGGGIVLEATADDHGLKWLGRGLMAGGVGAAILGVGELAVRSEAERLADLSRTAPTSHVHVSPRIGLGNVGLTGTF